MHRALPVALCALLLPLFARAETPAGPSAAERAAAAPVATVENGSTVQFEYTLHDERGELIGTNKGQEPITYTQGQRQIMGALEVQLSGMRAGEEKHVVLKPEDAYGPVDPAARTEVPKASLPPDALVVGARLMARTAAGEERPVMVREIKPETVVLDLNHPLAGRTLVFDVKVLSIAPAKPTSPDRQPAASGGEGAARESGAAPKATSPPTQESTPAK